MDVRDAEAVSQRLAGQPGVPVVAVDQPERQALLANPAGGVFDPLGDRFAERFLRDEFVAAAWDADDPRPLGNRFDERLVLETPRQNVDGVSHAGEALGELQDVHDLTAGVGFTELRLCRHVAVRGDHENSFVFRRGHLVFLSP